MAEMDEACQFSLMSLEEELTCSICLSPFHCPVTIPCGHNFCQDCLLATWKDSSYSCPQCRTAFSTQPELKKNTVLSTVVETFNLRSNKSEGRLSTEESKAPAVAVVVVRCDACMEVEASQTCLTCMASFCEEHLRPHRDNPVFRLHQLSEPLGDLMERICPDHHKLMELYCSQHGRPICSLCLQQVHKGCPFKTPEEQRNLKESDLRGKLSLLDGKITKNENIVSQMSDMQNKLKDSATDRKKTLAAEYQQMRDILGREEQDAVTAVDRELESGQTKLKTFLKKFTDNINSIGKAKEDIHGLLSQSHTLAFLQASYDLPAAANFEPFNPRISLDSKKVIATQAFASALKEYLTEVLKQPVEARQRMLKPELNTDNVAPGMKAGPVPENTSTQPERDPSKERRNPRSHSPGRPPINPLFRPAPGQSYGGPPAGWYPPHYAQGEGPPFAPGYGPMNHGPYPGPGPHWHPGHPRFPGPHGPGVGNQPNTGPKKKQRTPKKASQSTEANKGKMKRAGSKENLLDLNQQRCHTPESESTESPETLDIPPDITSEEKRSELLKYGTVLTLNAKTAHRRIELSEGLTKATVSDEHTDYPEHASRFAVCSQVLASKGFTRGRHYWEVRMSSNNFIGIGLAYSSIDRKGPTSRLGRNAQSWCVEWFNVKLSAWHDSKENVLVNPNSKRVGVLLDCEGGTATFYNIMGQTAYPFHSFVFPFAEAVFPAFWIFSSGSSIALCKLQA